LLSTFSVYRDLNGASTSFAAFNVCLCQCLKFWINLGHAGKGKQNAVDGGSLA
jgi:hypothetical protein